MCTRCPSAVAMFTNASSKKRDTRPRRRSLMRGCDAALLGSVELPPVFGLDQFGDLTH